MQMADGIFLVAVAVMVACSFYFSPRIARERIAMQWGLDGRPTWSMPKRYGLWALIVFALVVRAVVFVAVRLAPDKVHGAEQGLSAFALVVAICHAMILSRAAKRDATK